MPRMDIELLTLTEAARRIGISRDVVRDLINSGWIATIELPGGSRRVPAQAVADWIERAQGRPQGGRESAEVAQ